LSGDEITSLDMFQDYWQMTVGMRVRKNNMFDFDACIEGMLGGRLS